MQFLHFCPWNFGRKQNIINWKNWVSSKHSHEPVECTFDNQAKKGMPQSQKCFTQCRTFSKITFSPKTATYSKTVPRVTKKSKNDKTDKKIDNRPIFLSMSKTDKISCFFQKKVFIKNLYGQLECNFWKQPVFWARRSKNFLLAQGLKIFEKNDYFRRKKKNYAQIVTLDTEYAVLTKFPIKFREQVECFLHFPKLSRIYQLRNMFLLMNI